MSTPASKVCTGCERRLTFDHYRRRAASPDGRQWRCKRCQSDAEAEARRPGGILAFQEACGRALRRRSSAAAAEADARLLEAVDKALSRRRVSPSLCSDEPGDTHKPSQSTESAQRPRTPSH